MNQRLRALFAAELKELRSNGKAGEATEKYLLDYNKNIKIPNVIYCVLQMLGSEYENPEVMYTEYRGSCPSWDHKSDCQTFAINEGEIRWCFWYVNSKDVLNITAKPANSLGDADCSIVEDNGENVILFNLYAKLAYQCMIIYDTRFKCYLPLAVFRMAKYVLFLFSYKAFYAALKSAIKYQDEEANYVIREVLSTILGLEDVKPDEIYSKISHMQGSEKAAVARVIVNWNLGGDLQRRLKENVDEFIRMLSHSRIRDLVEAHEEEVMQVLGGELFYQMQKLCKRNMSIS